jgi:Flp pilus assembly pilin Flp
MQLSGAGFIPRGVFMIRRNEGVLGGVRAAPRIFWRNQMKKFMLELWREEGGTDLVEYTLLMAAICLAGAAMFISMGSNTSSMWSIVNSRLASNQPS